MAYFASLNNEANPGKVYSNKPKRRRSFAERGPPLTHKSMLVNVDLMTINAVFRSYRIDV